MNRLILHPTEISQWQALVIEAQASTSLILNEGTESYLVFLLMRFTQGPKLIESVLALDFLDSVSRPKAHQLDSLRDIGDKSLLFCGLFPGMAKKRHVSLNYFSNMGQAAYLSLGELEKKDTALLYFQLGEKFTELQQILQAMRCELPQNHPFNIEVFPRGNSTLQ